MLSNNTESFGGNAIDFVVSDFSMSFFCRERGARALEERLAAEKLATAQSVEESKKDDASENV